MNKPGINAIEMVIFSQRGKFTLPNLQTILISQDNKNILRTLYRLEDAGMVEKTGQSLGGRSLYVLSEKGRALADSAASNRQTKKAVIKPKSNEMNYHTYLEFCEKVNRIQEIINTIQRDEQMAAWWRYCEEKAKHNSKALAI